jgi:hypothetical protein
LYRLAAAQGYRIQRLHHGGIFEAHVLGCSMLENRCGPLGVKQTTQVVQAYLLTDIVKEQPEDGTPQ